MPLAKSRIHEIEVIHSQTNINYNNFLICIPGGGKIIGASRFDKLQERLQNVGIGSISLNFPGVEGSTGSVKNDSLEARINLVCEVIEWVRNSFKFDTLSLYGISMGAYVAMGVSNKINYNGKLILQVAAAYAKEAHNTNFNSDFTKILRTPDSWKNSMSFAWLKEEKHPVFLITHSDDQIIPKEISQMYIDIVFKKKNRFLEIDGATHSMWTEYVHEKTQQEIINFIV